MNIHTLATCLIFSFAAFHLPGQEVVRNPDDRQVIVYPDGTWKYFVQDTVPVIESPEVLYTPSPEQLSANRSEWETAIAQTKQLKIDLIKERVKIAGLATELMEMEAAGEPAEKIKQKQLSLEASRKNERHYKQLLERSEEWSRFLETLVYMPSEIRIRTIAEWQREHEEIEQVGDKNGRESNRQGGTVKTARAVSPALPAPGTSKTPGECVLAFSGKDPVTGGWRKETKGRQLFSHTDKGLEGHFGKRDLITGRGYLTSMTGGLRLFNLELAIASHKAPQLFGVFLSGGFIEIHLLDGTSLRLINNVSDAGVWEELLQSYIYRCQYRLGLREEKMLRQSEVDRIVIRWSKVQDEFEIYDVDFFIEQFECLDHGK